MKRFARALSVWLGLVALGSVISLAPQKNAAATGSAPVTITNTSANPVQVSGTVNANIINTNTNGPVSVSGTVGVINPLDASGNNIPLVIRDADNGARQPFTGVDSCNFDPVAHSCGAGNVFVPKGKTLVLEDVSGQCTLVGQFSLSQVQVVLAGPASQEGTLFFSPLAISSSASQTIFSFGRTVKAYLPGGETLIPSNLLLSVASSTQGGCSVTYSGYLVS